MKILLVNDDGIAAPGLAALYTTLADMSEITVVAPDGERSAIGHGITLDRPIPVREYGNAGLFTGTAVNGTPADCVKLALSELMAERPDFVVSGINLGCNSGLNVIYSGTVAAAAEAVFNGIPGIAISLSTYSNPNWRPAQRFIRKLLQRLEKNSLPPGVLLNVNVPNVQDETQIAGVRVTEQSMARWLEDFSRRSDPKGRTYYWMSGAKENKEMHETIDDTAINNNYISVTPVQFNLTAYREMPLIEALKIDY